MEAWARPAGNLSAARADGKLRGGLLILAIALAVAVVAMKLGFPREYRALFFVPFFLAANGFFQALYKT